MAVRASPGEGRVDRIKNLAQDNGAMAAGSKGRGNNQVAAPPFQYLQY
jgi:hypothetical protein